MKESSKLPLSIHYGVSVYSSWLSFSSELTVIPLLAPMWPQDFGLDQNFYLLTLLFQRLPILGKTWIWDHQNSLQAFFHSSLCCLFWICLIKSHTKINFATQANHFAQLKFSRNQILVYSCLVPQLPEKNSLLDWLRSRQYNLCFGKTSHYFLIVGFIIESNESYSDNA